MTSWREIEADLSTPLDDSPAGLDRRRFLQMVGAGASVTALGPLALRASSLGAQAAGPSDGLLCLIMLGGGNDGTNTVAPIDDGRYRAARGSLALDQATAHRIDGGLAMHPSLGFTKQMYDQGQCAVVQGIGYRPASLSHFDSMAYWMAGELGTEVGQGGGSGWIGRWLDGAGAGAFGGVSLGSGVPLHMRGRHVASVGMPSGSPPDLGSSDRLHERQLFDALVGLAAGTHPHGPLADSVAERTREAMALSAQISTAYRDPLPSGGFERTMAIAARVLGAGIGVRVVSVSIGGFDTHRDAAGQHTDLMAELDAGVQSFFANLAPAVAGRTAVATFSEFGRRWEVNGSNGVDHDTASVALVYGSRVRGGLHGAYPSTADLDGGNLKPQVDFRSYYADIVDTWLGGDSREVLAGGAPEPLDLFRSGPGSSSPIGVAPDPNASQGYMLVRSTGAVTTFGNQVNHGSAAGPGAVSIRANPAGTGYWIARSDGGVEAFGAAAGHGSMEGTALAAPVIDMAVHPSGEGYWLLGSDGGIFTFGSGVRFHGSTGGMALVAPVVGMAAHPSGEGYWFCASDGGVFTFGPAARFHGSAGDIALAAPVVGMAAHPSGDGYWLVARDGGVFTYGSGVRFHGSTGGMQLDSPIRGMKPAPDGNGYWLFADDGGVFTFGSCRFHGSLGGQGHRDVVSMG